MSDPKISVIVPVYDPGDYLQRCIESILDQTERDLELILVDDGSTDGSGEVCDGYAARDSRVRVIHKANAGVSAARNDGIRAARGQFLAFVDSDDHPEPDMYERLLAAAERTGCDAVFCGFRRVFQDREETETFLREHCYDKEQLRELAEDLMKARVFGAIWRGIYAARTVAGIRFDEDIRYAEDLLFNLEVLQHASGAAVIPDVLYNYNKANENSICARTERDPDFRYTAALQKQLKLNEYWQIPLDPQEFYRVYVDMMFQFLVRKLQEGESDALVEQYLTEGFFARCCHYDQKIPMRRRIVCILIRKRCFRLAVAVRRLEDAVLALLGR